MLWKIMTNRRFSSLLMTALFLIYCLLLPLPANAAETEEQSAFTEEITIETDGQSFVPDAAGESDNEERFADYVGNSFGGKSSSGRRKASRSAAAGLSGVDLTVFNIIASILPEIAAGERASTVFEIPVEELELEKTSWTAQELGVSSIVETDEAGNTVVAKEAVSAVEAKVSYNLKLIVNALLADYPYQLYWYEKTQNTVGSGFKMNASYDSGTGEYVLALRGGISISFPVSEDYSAGEFLINTEIGRSVQTSVKNANAIVERYSALSDYEKLCAYRDEICALVSYNYGAAAGESGYGNPWQIIWVFDGDPFTNVVCEGYAKAFKYLCDLSAFENEIGCITVTGNMSGGTGEGSHMWNVVRMDDGNNYLADVTNCDEGTVGSPDLLFLAGADEVPAEGKDYVFYAGQSPIEYIYSNDTTSIFPDSDLKIFTEDYAHSHEHVWDEGITAKESTVFEEGIRIYTCIECGKQKEESIPAKTGWGKDNSGWKYRKADGTFATGWLYDGGKWYLMDSGGVMLTGWQKTGGKWYYMNGSGAMTTGWQYIGGKWYYMNGSGAMVTGWQKIGGKWYYMNGSGAMRTGWQKIGGKWYYMNGSGAMVTGWQKIGGKWYYMNGSGAMVTGWQTIGGKRYYFEPGGALRE